MDDEIIYIELTQTAVKNLISSFSGQENVLTIPRAYLDWLDGDHVAALMFSQILYWTERTDDEDGWIYKSSKQWHDELAISTYQQKRAVKKLEVAGVETTLKKANGAPTVHYRINQAVFSKWIMEKLTNRESREGPIREKLANGFENPSEIESTETVETLPTEITSEITQRTVYINSSIDGMNAGAIWDAAIDAIESSGSVRAGDVSGYLRPARLLGVRDDGVLIVKAPTAPAARRIEAHLLPDIERAVSRWLGRDVRIEVTA